MGFLHIHKCLRGSVSTALTQGALGMKFDELGKRSHLQSLQLEQHKAEAKAFSISLSNISEVPKKSRSGRCSLNMSLRHQKLYCISRCSNSSVQINLWTYTHTSVASHRLTIKPRADQVTQVTITTYLSYEAPGQWTLQTRSESNDSPQ